MIFMKKFEDYFKEHFVNYERAYTCYNDSIAKMYNGKKMSLYEHTENVFNELVEILDTRDRTFDKYASFGGNIDDLKNDIFIAIILHDYGKIFPIWQRAIINDNIRRVNFRHETGFLCNLVKNKKDFYDLYHIIIPILAHHNNLSNGTLGKSIKKFDNYGDDKLLETKAFGDIRKIIDEYAGNKTDNLSDALYGKIYNSNYIKEFNYDTDSKYKWLKLFFIRHYLQLADKRASIKESGIKLDKFNYLPKNDTFYSINPQWKLRELQNICSSNSDELLLLRAPTGAGKTSACLLWANNQFKLNRCERLIIAMPTQFTSNSLANNISHDDGLFTKKVNVQHSGRRYDSENITNKIYNDTFENIINVSTIDQILYSLNLGSEKHKSASFNIANSCVVIDESDFYDDFVLANILKAIKILREYNVPIMLMSATMPDSFVTLLNEELGTNLTINDDKSDLDRKRSRINNIYDLNEEDVRPELLRNIINKEQVIIYANTIKSAKKYYNDIINLIPNRKDEIVLYHSQFTKVDKIKIEEKILSLLGKDGKGTGIIIMTQIGELSINISSNYILSEMCPIDRLIQRMGRGCRFDENICDVDIIIPINDDNMFNPAPYGEYVKNERKWLANQPFERTVNLLKTKEYNGWEYLEMVNEVYDNFSFSVNSEKNSDSLTDNFNNNVFFNVEYNNDIDSIESSQSEWKSRDILPQVTLLVGEPPINDGANNYYYKLKKYIYENSLDISYHGINKLKQHEGIIKVKEIHIKDEHIEKVIMIDKEHYNSEVGIEINVEHLNKTHEFI